MTTLVEAAKDLAQRTQKVETEVNKADRASSRAPRAKVRPQGATTYDQAKRSEHTGAQGERAYGAPMTSDADRHRNQHTDSNNR